MVAAHLERSVQLNNLYEFYQASLLETQLVFFHEWSYLFFVRDTVDFKLSHTLLDDHPNLLVIAVQNDVGLPELTFMEV